MNRLLRAAAMPSVIAALLLAALAAAAAETPTPGQADHAGFDLSRPEIAAFVDRMVAKDGFTRADVLAVLAGAKPRPELTEAMSHPVEKTLQWWQYRARFVTAGRIATGVAFWKEHRAELEPIAAQAGIAPEYLVSILGMETNYGRSTGSYREVDTLMTLAFDYPSRGEYFREELRQFLLLGRDAGLDLVTTRGSYGGALGVLQFMPSSYRRFAVNQSHLPRIDLWTDWPDIFASVTRFLQAHGWHRDGPVVAEASVAAGAHLEVSGHLTLNDTVGGLAAKGVRVDPGLPAGERAVLVEAPLEDEMRYRVGFQNLRVISRYNPSINYSLAVCDLAAELRRALAAEAAPDPGR